MNGGAVIEIKDLRKVYERAFRPPKISVDGLSLEVRRGEVFGLIGPNGAGKTTTLKCLLGFTRPSAGELRLLSRKPGDASAHTQLGFLPETAVYYPFLTARQTLALYARLFGLPREESRRRVERLLDLVHLTPHADDKIQTYSKGMAQRVGIAQALINNPEIMILDEPATGLDPVGQKEIRDLIARLRSEGKTVFFSSHELGEVEGVCDRVAIVTRGKIRREGTLAELCPLEDAWRLRVRGEAEILRAAAQKLNAQALRQFPAEQIWRIPFPPGRAGIQAGLQDWLRTLDWPKDVELVSVERIQKSLEQTFLETIAGE